jgi:hypothetical protein
MSQESPIAMQNGKNEMSTALNAVSVRVSTYVRAGMKNPKKNLNIASGMIK